jgi:hypothetical protein
LRQHGGYVLERRQQQSEPASLASPHPAALYSYLTERLSVTSRHSSSLNSARTARGRVGSPSSRTVASFQALNPRIIRLCLRHNPAIFQDHAF